MRLGKRPHKGWDALFSLLSFILLLTGLITGIFSCRGPRENGPDGILTVAGSTSVQPFAEKLAEEFMHKHPDQLINVQGGGSTAGIRAVQTGVAQIGMSSRDLKPEEDLRKIVIVYDGIAVIVHKSNPVQNISRENISDIFTGEITRWEKVGGLAGEIHFITREEGSGTRGAFENLVMGKKNISPRALVQDSNGAVREIVAGDPKSLGYISLGIVDDRVKAIAVDGVSPTGKEISSKRYALVRPFLFLTRDEPEGKVKDFIDFTLGHASQKLLADEGLIPVVE